MSPISRPRDQKENEPIESVADSPEIEPKGCCPKAGISQAALSQMERIDNEHRTATLVKLAKPMGVSVDQLKD